MAKPLNFGDEKYDKDPDEEPLYTNALRFNDDILRDARALGIKFDFSKIVIVPESEYSSLRPDQIPQVNKALRKWYKHTDDISVLDCTAHVGVDTLNFQTALNARVIAVEIGSRVFELLNYNVRNRLIMTVRGDIVALIRGHESSQMLLQMAHSLRTCENDDQNDDQNDKLNQFTFAYLDPPWGGPNYWKIKHLRLTLSGVAIEHVICDLLCKKIANAVVIKMPSNGVIDDDLLAARAVLKRSATIYKPARKDGKKHIAYILREYVRGVNLRC